MNWASSTGDVYFSNFSSGSNFVYRSKTFRAVLVEDLMRNMCEIILNLGRQFKKRCHIKNFLFFALAAILLQVEPFGKFGRGHYEEYLCEII